LAGRDRLSGECRIRFIFEDTGGRIDVVTRVTVLKEFEEKVEIDLNSPKKNWWVRGQFLYTTRLKRLVSTQRISAPRNLIFCLLPKSLWLSPVQPFSIASYA
jgi:hypothetical protein